MKIKNKKNTKKIVVISTLIIALAVIGAVCFYIINNTNSDQSLQKNSSEIAKKSESDKKQEEEINDNPEYKDTKTNTDIPAPIITDESTGKKTLQMVASADISDGILYIRGGINNSVEYDGTCFAQLAGPNGESIRKDTTLLQNAATTDCKTIQVNTSELAKGSWKLVLNYSSNDAEGASSEASFEIK